MPRERARSAAVNAVYKFVYSSRLICAHCKRARERLKSDPLKVDSDRYTYDLSLFLVSAISVRQPAR